MFPSKHLCSAYYVPDLMLGTGGNRKEPSSLTLHGGDGQTSQHRQHNPICALMGEIRTKGRFQRVAHKDGEQELDYIFIKLVANNIN